MTQAYLLNQSRNVGLIVRTLEAAPQAIDPAVGANVFLTQKDAGNIVIARLRSGAIPVPMTALTAIPPSTRGWYDGRVDCSNVAVDFAFFRSCQQSVAKELGARCGLRGNYATSFIGGDCLTLVGVEQDDGRFAYHVDWRGRGWPKPVMTTHIDATGKRTTEVTFVRVRR